VQRYIDEFRIAQERAKAAAREAELAEQRRIEAYNASRAGRAEAVAKAKAEDDAAKETRWVCVLVCMSCLCVCVVFVKIC
jgi:hypothetical protein